MGTQKKAANAYAKTLGFDDVRYAGIHKLLSSDLSACQKGLESATCTAVLFKSYRPAAPAPEGTVALSEYYVASHASYHAAKAFAAYLESCGHEAMHLALLPAKKIALQTGGFIGDNGFYYHPDLGSLVCIQTVLTNAFLPDPPLPSPSSCLHCGVCSKACPSGGVGDLQRCLRKHSNALIPKTLRGDVYQLLGCEKCQSVCPLNLKDTSAPKAFLLESLLDGKEIKKLRELAGPNMARKSRIISQAAIYAANTGQKQCMKQLLFLAQNADAPVRDHAQWAYEILNGDTV